MSTTLLELCDVSRVFTRNDGAFDSLARRLGVGRPLENLVAVDNVSMVVNRGETVGIVGESGCGKSTLGRVAVQLLAPSSGKVLFEGKDIATLPVEEARRARFKLQMVFQNPYTSLNPRRRVGETVIEAAVSHGLVAKADARDAAIKAMGRVGLKPDFIDRFPHALSGGQRQRVGIARALAVDPACVVFDEAVAALDVSIQAQILELLVELRQNASFASVFISHDLNVVRYIADRVVILYLGRVVETASTATLFEKPHHPYSQALMAEAPELKAQKRIFTPIVGELPSPLSPPSGCQFHPRCPHAMPRCKTEQPALRQLGDGHFSACHLDMGQADEKHAK
ncbi:ABC transporter ATP-binding protein [Kiloniella laminariae]|uniref:ABC transporter ATP-binding protein n=1 Tax=Kiloniella laminariae TaxID=454162 RepID=UPI000368842D|nr:oligopeptide/dipeptide ABC transporter ATP-binding protein [Kiloniella laminariae]